MVAGVGIKGIIGKAEGMQHGPVLPSCSNGGPGIVHSA